MKKRIISIILTFVMILTSAATVSVAAETNEDLATTVAAALADSDTATVTLTTDATASTAISVPAGKTLTIEGSGKTYTAAYGFAANGGTLTVKNLNVILSAESTAAYAEVANGGTLSFENCTFAATSTITRPDGHFVFRDEATDVTTMNLTNCQISVSQNTSQVQRGVFYSGIKNAVLSLDNVDFDTSATDPFLTACYAIGTDNASTVTIKNGSEIKTGHFVVNFPNVTVEDSTLASTLSSGVNYVKQTTNVDITFKGTSLLDSKYEGIRLESNSCPINVTVEGDSVINSNGAATVFAWKSSGKTNVTVGDNAVIRNTRNGNGRAIVAQECSSAVDFTVKDNVKITAVDAIYMTNNSGKITLNMKNSAYAEGSGTGLVVINNRAVFDAYMDDFSQLIGKVTAVIAQNNSAAVNLTLGGDSKIFSNATSGRAVFAVGNNSNHLFNLTLEDNATLFSQKSGISFEQESGYITKANITLKGTSSISAMEGDGIILFKTITNLNVANTAKVKAYGVAYTKDASNTDSVITGDTFFNSASFIDPSQLPTMVEGASLRVQGASLGLRFSATYRKPMQQYPVTPTYGILITTEENLAQIDSLSVEALEKAGLPYITIDAKDGIVNNVMEGTRTFNVALVNIKPENYGKIFYARAYAKYEDGGRICYEYSAFDPDVNCGSVKEEAYEVLSDVKSASQGSYKYEVESYVQKSADGYVWIEEKAYSKYYTTQIPAIKAFTEDVQTGGNER